MYTQLSNKYFPGLLLWISEVLYTTKPLLPRKLNLCEKTFLRNGARHAFVVMFSVACYPTLLDSELETWQNPRVLDPTQSLAQEVLCKYLLMD